jgi:hypothetical protein
MGSIINLFTRRKTLNEEAVSKILHKFHGGIIDVAVALHCPDAIVGSVCSTFAAQAAVAVGMPRHEFLEAMAEDFDAAVADSAEEETV